MRVPLHSESRLARERLHGALSGSYVREMCYGLICVQDCPLVHRTRVEIYGKSVRANFKSGRAYRRSIATLRRTERLLRRRSNASVSPVGRWSRADGRWSTVDWRGSSVAWAPHYVARNFCCVDVQTLLCRQRVDVRVSGATLSSRETSVT